MPKGKIIIISGPSGSGKTTIYRQLLKSSKLKSRLVKSISSTTRGKREGEVEGRDYFFLSQKMFAYKKRTGQFLESKKVFNNYYGTPKKFVEESLAKGKNVLLAIDVQGAKEVMKKAPNVVSIFIKTKSVAELKKRLLKRGSEDSEDLRIRLEVAKQELKESVNYDHVVMNDDLNKTYAFIEDLICQKVGID